ncbi:aminotransferase class I/II-fold pyridoxal phosphate-dependent enzyme [Kiloniella laminariae]|uniref:aminotransferase class I/II-fold pyridoxal phosphate-dependent enzyme n=1 Tax=Kiloniella laminariae TaxID=454162 RepID=UPI000373D8FE|nr:8-amino-7-oxononanoate synthase [Kiloniella laminariae]
MVGLSSSIQEYLKAIPEPRYRILKNSTPLSGGIIKRGEIRLVNFASNDYLGLAQDPRLVERATSYAREFGTGSGASRLVTGNSPAYELIEQKLADLKGTEAALLLNSGFQANATVLASLLNKFLHRGPGKSEALLFTDKLNHASLHFGAQAAQARQIRFRHNDLGHLEELLEKSKEQPGNRIIVTESVFSMDGDILDVERVRQLARQHDAFLYIDEAHATGVFGKNGMGLCAGGISRDELVLGTFGKGLGSYGAYIACSQNVRDYLVNACPGLIYATALPPQVLGAIDAALDLVPGMETQRQYLKELGSFLREGLEARGFSTGGSTSQIIPVIIGDDATVIQVARKLEDKGYLVGAIRPPTVPEGSGRLRITLSAAHSHDQVAGLLEALVSTLEEVGS